MDTTVTSQGNIGITLASWEALIEDITMIINQGCSNFIPESNDSWTQLGELPDPSHLLLNKVYLCSITRTIRLESIIKKDKLDICLGAIQNSNLVTGRILGDLICASRSYREDGDTLELEYCKY
jgi:hypothetical protein